MIHSWFRQLWTASALAATAALIAQERPAETWQTSYTGADANGPGVLGYWRFEAGAELLDSSGKGHTLTLAGAVATAGGRWGGGLESFAGGPANDRRHAALAAAKPALSPKGSFTLEMWVKPKAELAAESSPVLVDKKYVAHTDYQWRLTAADKGGARRMQVALGFGEESATYRSEPFQLGTAWQHLAFTYDGAGEVQFLRNGAPLGGGRQPGRGAVTAGRQLSFSPADRAAYRRFAGAAIPAEVTTKRGVDWRKLPGFPADRVIPDDHPVRRYLHWFWTVGDGWNALHTAVHRGLHSTGRDEVWTWFDPAIRAASVGGSGGEVDVLSQWTYTNPDSLRIGYFADEVFAMAAAAAPRRPQVMKMTQLFWYRTQSAPKKEGAAHIASPFDDHDPDAAYITIAPAHLRESFWTKLARPVDGIMYHGWQALVPTESTSGYRYTHPDTKEEFRRLHRGVAQPLGPTLRQVGDRRSDVAYLDSFTAQMFAGRGSYGYSSEEAYLTLLYAQLQPEVLFEETLISRGLDGYRLLVLADCDVLPASVVARVREFQRRGGRVIGDENLAPAIRADVQMPRFTRQKKGDRDQATLLANAAKLRASLGASYARYADSRNPEVVVRVRAAGESDYVFVVNDRREFGDYVGQHGLVMEHGLPAETEISVGRTAGGVYDLVAARPTAAAVRAGRLAWPAELGPGEGRVFLVTPRAIHGVALTAPAAARAGEAVEVNAVIADEAGRPVPAVVPVQVEIQDPAGRLAEFSGYYGAREGTLRLRLDLAPNDRPGVWQIRVRELASGLAATRHLRVGVERRAE